MNHFRCAAYPSDSHYSIEGDVVHIDWGKFGKYTMTMDHAARSMHGEPYHDVRVSMT